LGGKGRKGGDGGHASQWGTLKGIKTNLEKGGRLRKQRKKIPDEDSIMTLVTKRALGEGKKPFTSKILGVGDFTKKRKSSNPEVCDAKDNQERGVLLELMKGGGRGVAYWSLWKEEKGGGRRVK